MALQSAARQQQLPLASPAQSCCCSIAGLPHQHFPTPIHSSSSSSKPHRKLTQHPVLSMALFLRKSLMNQGAHLSVEQEQGVAHLHTGPVQVFHHAFHHIGCKIARCL